jgi:hypothetical protein
LVSEIIGVSRVLGDGPLIASIELRGGCRGPALLLSPVGAQVHRPMDVAGANGP